MFFVGYFGKGYFCFCVFLDVGFVNGDVGLVCDVFYGWGVYGYFFVVYD